MEKITNEKLAESLRKILNQYGYDGVPVEPREINGVKVEYVQFLFDEVKASDAEGDVLIPFTSMTNEEAVSLYEDALTGLAS